MLSLGAVITLLQFNNTCDSDIDHKGDHQMAKGSVTAADVLGTAIL